MNVLKNNSKKSKSKSKKININANKIIEQYIKKQPQLSYSYYDDFLEDSQKPYFQKPIGLYDPFGENVNPLTLQPYQNLYQDSTPLKYDRGNGEGLSVPRTYKNFAYIWTALPLYPKATEIINSIRENNITLIKAGTGVGKSFLGGRLCSQAFNFQKKVLMTLPKKLLARKTASDTAETCDVVVGEEVGYYFKGAYEVDKNGKESKIIFTTTGSLIRKVTGDDPFLKDYSCIIIDEAHERTVQTDLLILFLKRALKERADLKVVFISATLNVSEFQNYFKDYSFNIVEMPPSTTAPITDFYESKKPDDWQKTAIEKVMNILRNGEQGDILVFIKSGGDANKMKQYLEPQIKTLQSKNGKEENPFITVLESGISKDEEKYATEEFLYLNHPEANPNKPYTRKIVFTTNVAESSLTVKGAVFVIDCGLALEDMYDPARDAKALLEKNISQSAVTQRRGRVGRTKPGTCYHLYSESELKTFPEYPIPSIQKSDLTMDALDIMKLEYVKNVGDLKKILQNMMSPPSSIFVDSALHNLYLNNAITSKNDDGILTDLGRAISAFSGLTLPMARSIIASYYYHCKYDIIPIIVITQLIGGRMDGLYLPFKPKGGKMEEKNFKNAVKKYEKMQHSMDHSYGDFMTIHNIYQQFRSFMKIPNEYPSKLNTQNILPQNGGGNNNNNNNNTTENIPIEKLTRKTAVDAKKWCIDHGISPRVFVDSRNKSSWDKVGNEVRKIENTLMSIIQPAELRKEYYKKYKEEGGNVTKRELEKEINASKKELMSINPENRFKVDEEEEEEEEKQSIHNKQPRNEVLEGGYVEKTVFKNYIQYGGYNNKPFELNYFPNAVLMEKREDNIMMALAHGFFTHMVKHKHKNFYQTCVPLQPVDCYPDMKSTLSLKAKPSYLIYYELFMLRENQPSLKLNIVNRLPTTVLKQVKDSYGDLIENCYKAIKSNYGHYEKKKGKRFIKRKSIRKFSRKRRY